MTMVWRSVIALHGGLVVGEKERGMMLVDHAAYPDEYRASITVDVVSGFGCFIRGL